MDQFARPPSSSRDRIVVGRPQHQDRCRRPLADLRDAAWSLQAGGVGYYPREQFVHIDTGRVRHW